MTSFTERLNSSKLTVAAASEAFGEACKNGLRQKLLDLGLNETALAFDVERSARFGTYAQSALEKVLSTTVGDIDPLALAGKLRDQAGYKEDATISRASYNDIEGPSLLSNAIPEDHPDHAFYAHHRGAIGHAMEDFIEEFARDLVESQRRDQGRGI